MDLDDHKCYTNPRAASMFFGNGKGNVGAEILRSVR